MSSRAPTIRKARPSTQFRTPLRISSASAACCTVAKSGRRGLRCAPSANRRADRYVRWKPTCSSRGLASTPQSTHGYETATASRHPVSGHGLFGSRADAGSGRASPRAAAGGSPTMPPPGWPGRPGGRLGACNAAISSARSSRARITVRCRSAEVGLAAYQHCRSIRSRFWSPIGRHVHPLGDLRRRGGRSV
jgi:hypothetical protein